MKKFDRTKVPSKILFDVTMTIYAEDNDTFCTMNEYLGEIFSYKDLEDYSKYIEQKEERLIEKALITLGLNVEDYLLKE